MSFFKSLLNVINPLPAIIKANSVSGQSFGDKLLNVINPAQSLIKENTGLTQLQLSDEYKALTSGDSVLTQSEIDAAKSGVLPAEVQTILDANKTNVSDLVAPVDNTKLYIIVGAAVLALFIMRE
ncbi:MAG: hypothetical protein J0I84_00080 [Terrimonas sp.]|nr:hypothetical protein [Terrimonas sp.]OJY90616.1 MAG: hypothetical protein BGP13_19520 [Sphingobacteriales bacterium 40-81]